MSERRVLMQSTRSHSWASLSSYYSTEPAVIYEDDITAFKAGDVTAGMQTFMLW